MSVSLYDVFHEHLMSPEVTEDLTAETFAEKVVSDYLTRIIRSGHIIPAKIKSEIEDDLKDEVVGMTRKKTYGHFSISSYQKSKFK
jgi:hypothetical protein